MNIQKEIQKIHRWRTKKMFASGTWDTADEQMSGSPVVTYLPLANMMFASGKLLPLAIVALANRMFASDSQNRFVSGRLFPTSESLNMLLGFTLHVSYKMIEGNYFLFNFKTSSIIHLTYCLRR